MGQKANSYLGPTQYMEIRYEVLVTQPERVLGKICQFLGEDFHPAMLDHTQLARKTIGNRGHVEVRGDLSAESVQRWQKQLSDFEKRLADAIAGSTLDSLGYKRANVGKFLLTEKIKVIFLFGRYQIVNLIRKLLIRFGFLRINRGKERK